MNETRLTKADLDHALAARVVAVAEGLTSGIYTDADASAAVMDMAALVAEYKAQSLPHVYIPTSPNGSIVPCAVCGNDRNYPKHTTV